MQRPGIQVQRPSTMNPLNFNRGNAGSAAGGGTNGGNASGAPSPAGYNFLARPSPGANAGSGSTPFNRGFPFGASSIPPHLAGFASQGATGGTNAVQGQSGQQGQSGSLNISDFPALGGSFNSAPSIGGGTMSYANSTVGSRGGPGVEAGTGLNADDFPSLSDGFNMNATNGAGSQQANQEQASAAATLQHQRLAREQNPSQQSLNAARGGFGDAERNYATKVGMQQPPGMAAAQNWFSANFGGATTAGMNGSTGAAAGSNAPLQSPAIDSRTANQALDGGLGGQGGMDGQQVGVGNVGNTNLLLPNIGSTAIGAPSQSVGATAKTPAQQVLTSPADRFGLSGLLSIIKMQDPDMSMLAMGSDLQTLGLNLNAQDALSTSFITPWSENAAAAALQVEPEFHLPSCYNVQPPPPPQSKIASFSDETLFFIFYSTSRDILQEIAAQELYNRNWRFYRGGLNLWLTKEENVQPTHKDLRAEKGVYIFWDPASWSKVSREFVLAYDALEERSMGVSQAQLLAANSSAGQQQPQQGGGQQIGTPQQQQSLAAAQQGSGQTNQQAQQGAQSAST